jgi:hypothetical protein
MKITIAERLRPFCHLPGTACPVPWSPWKVEIFPTLLKFCHMIDGRRYEERLDWKGPILDFTVELDLEKGAVVVFGHTAQGYRRHNITVTEMLPRKPLERLSLGSHKALDWELVRRRKEMKDILPVWHHLGQMVPMVETKKVGAASLLHPYEKMAVEKGLLTLFLAGFEKMMVPRLSDSDHQGIIEEGEFSGSPLILLTAGAKLIRSCFFQESAEGFNFLPCLAPAWHAGRFVNIETRAGDGLDVEWSKKLLRTVVIRPQISREISLSVQKPLGSFRLRKSMKDKGVRCSADRPLMLEKGQTLYLDRFEKS